MRVSLNFQGQQKKNVQAEISGAPLSDADATLLMKSISDNIMNKAGGDSYYHMNSVQVTTPTGNNGMDSDAQEDTSEVIIKYPSGARDYYWWLTVPTGVTVQTIKSKFEQYYSAGGEPEVSLASSQR